jgi:hypothetical protein
MGFMKWLPDEIYKAPIQVGSLLVQRIPSSSARYRVTHKHYWRGYLFPIRLPIKFLGKVGKLIEVRTLQELDAACAAYRASLEPGVDTRLAYYEVIDESPSGG